jgi:hypothetical protein
MGRGKNRPNNEASSGLGKARGRPKGSKNSSTINSVRAKEEIKKQ